MREDQAILLESVSKTFTVYESRSMTIRDSLMNAFSMRKRREIEALKAIDLEVKSGEFLGVIGRNGSGKSTLLHVMSGAYPPDKGGKVSINGMSVRLSLGMGFNNELSAKQNVYINASLLGLTFSEIDNCLMEIIRFAEVGDFIDTKIKYFSKGMRTRLAFSVALHTRAEILLMDEVFGGVGDTRFRQKANKAFKEKILHNRTVVLASHNANIIRKFADRVVLLDKGQIVNIGSADRIMKEYRLLTMESRN